jgi:hypothetical protein
VVTICTTSLTFNNSSFCPHTVFMCFVWIWEQTAIISLYSINWLVFITERGLFTARYGLHFYMMFPLVFVFKGSAVAKVVSRVPFRAEVRVRSQVKPCGTWSGQIGTGAGFSPSILGLCCQFQSTTAPYSSLSTRCLYQNDKRAKPGNLPESNAFSEIGEHWMEKWLHCLFVSKTLTKWSLWKHCVVHVSVLCLSPFGRIKGFYRNLIKMAPQRHNFNILNSIITIWWHMRISEVGTTLTRICINLWNCVGPVVVDGRKWVKL